MITVATIIAAVAIIVAIVVIVVCGVEFANSFVLAASSKVWCKGIFTTSRLEMIKYFLFSFSFSKINF